MDSNDAHMIKPDIEYADNYVHNNSYLKGYIDGVNLALGVRIDIKQFEGMTNGEVMKAVFPKISVFENIDVRYPYMDVFYPNESDMPMHSYKKDWWNAPYKAESEVKQDD